MIKVEFLSNNTDDVCNDIENRITNGIDIEKWIESKINDISFICMDFPCDMEFCYDCYFKSNNDKLKANEIHNMLKSSFQSFLDIEFCVSVTDDMLN